jgi:hypothetical protein
VSVEDNYGNVVLTNSSSVTLALTTANGANLSCTTNPLAASSGVATYAGCNIDKAGTYTLTATDGSLTSAVSTTIALSAGTPSQLVFVQGPSNAFTGLAMTPAVTVQVEDAYGNAVSVNGLSITLTPSTGSITSGSVAPTSSGLATFSSTIWNQTYLGITITAVPTSSGTGISATPASSSFNVTVLADNGDPLTDLATDPPAGGMPGSGVASVNYYYCSNYSSTPACSASNGIPIGTSTGSSPYTVTWNGQPADGPYQVVAVATDHVNNTSLASVSTPVTIHNSGPSNSITAPVPATIYDGPSDTWQTSWSGSISGTASGSGGVPLQSVQYAIENNGNNEYWSGSTSSFSSSSQVLLTATGTTSWSASFLASNFATSGGGAGSYTLTVIATDTSGAQSTPVTSTFFIDENPTNTVFVSPIGNNSNSGLTSSAPKLTVAAGVAAAASAGRTVVAVGAASTGGFTYAEGALSLTSSDNNMSIEGGWNTSGWLRAATGTYAATITGNPIGIQIVNASNVTLQQLTVNGLNTSDAAGTSIYGVLVQSSTGVALQGVSLNSAAGIAGTTGTNGSAGTSGSPGTAGSGSTGEAGGGSTGGYGGNGSTTSGGTGSTGSGGSSPSGGGSGGGGGAGGTGGFLTGNPGATGTAGGVGPGGSAGTSGTYGTSVYGATYVGASGTSGGTGGPGGGGGGGGGGGDDNYVFGNDSGGGGGGGGSGGNGGTGGNLGTAAGGSFALYSYDSTVTVSSGSTITSVNGGNGGAGGSAGTGGTAGGGGGGASASGGAGGAGGVGGVGGAGGQGGGGAGGPSIGVVSVGTTVNTGSTTINFGTGGTNGSPGTGSAAGKATGP